MKKNKIAVGIGVAALVGAGASVLLYRKIKSVKRERHAASVVSEIKVISIDYPRCETLEEVFGKSDIVIQGQILSTEVKEITIGDYGDGEKVTHVYTVAKVKVLRVIKGNVQSGEVIFVKQLGDGEKVIASEFDTDKYFKKNQEYYLFLNSFGKSSLVMPYSCVNPYQASFRIEQDIIETKDIEVTVDSKELRESYSEGMTAIEFEKELEKYTYK